MTTFMDLWQGARERNHGSLCVGLDPDLDRIPGGDVLDWARRIIDATSDLVCAYKPNSAFYEALGTHGYELLRQVIASVPAGVPVIVDAKRADIGNTSAAYARAVFDVLGAHAITVHPYMGEDSVSPFLERADRGVFVLARTSNPGAREFQDLAMPAGEPLYLTVARRAVAWNSHGNVGLVTGATYPEDIALIREVCPGLPLLLPGVGAQQGELAAAVRAAAGPGGFMVNVARGVIYAQDVRAAALRFRDDIEAAREVPA